MKYLIAATAIAAANAIQMGSPDQDWTGHTNFYLKDHLDGGMEEFNETFNEAIDDQAEQIESDMASID